MRRKSLEVDRSRIRAFIAALALGTLLPAPALAWGQNAHKLIVSKAIETLPPELRPYFEGNHAFLLQHVMDAEQTANKTPGERRNLYLYLERYGRFPYESLPRSYKAAVAKFGRAKLEANGLLPWEVGVYSERLTNAMKAGRWEEARLDAAFLAAYVSQSHNPFSTTDNYDGQLTGQNGIRGRFGTMLIDRFSSFFPMRPNDPVFIDDATDHAFEACLSAHSWLETILLADRNARVGLPSYTDEYFDRFYNQAAAILIRQVSDAATDVASYWMTAWINAGRPALPPR